MQRGEIWWSNLPKPVGSGPGFRRPALIIQSDIFNRSDIRTVIVAVITTNLALASMPGNIFCSGRSSGLPRDCVINVSQILAVDRSVLSERIGAVSASVMRQVEEGLRLILALSSEGKLS
jgi:mRNA interferase MazF